LRARGKRAQALDAVVTGTRIRREVLCLGAYALLTLVATYPLILHVGDAIPGSGDAYQFYWNLWWVRRAMLQLHANPYVIGDVFYPYGAHLYFHGLNLLQGTLALPITLGLGLPAAYNSLVLLSFTLSGYGTYRLALHVLAHDVDRDEVAKHPGPARLAAFVGGAAFAFSSYRFVHLLGHLDLLSTQWLPLFVLFLLKTRREPGWWNPFWCGLFLAATTLTSSYYALFLFVFLAFFVASVLAHRGPGWRGALTRLAVALGVFATLVLPLLVAMLSRGVTEGRTSNPAYDLDRFSADLLAFVVPSTLHPVWGSSVAPAYGVMARNGSRLEAVMYVGVVPLLLAVAAVRAIGTRAWGFWLGGCALFTVLALGPVPHVGGRTVVPGLSMLMPYRLLSRLPYGDIPRVPARFVVMTTLCLSMVSAGGAWTLLRRLERRRALGAALALAGLILFENAGWPVPLGDLHVPPFYDRLAREPVRAGVIEAPIPDDPAVFPRRMLWQTVHGQPVFGGYLSRSLPPLAFEAVPGFAQFKNLSGTIDDVVRYDDRQLPAISLAVLDAYGAGHLVIEKDLLPPAGAERMIDVADALFGSAARVFEDTFIAAYEVPRGAPLQSAMWLDSGWSYLERLAEPGRDQRTLRWRWMSERARLGIMSPVPTRVRVRVTAQAFDTVRRLRLRLGGSDLAVWAIQRHRLDFETPVFDVPAGTRFVELTSLDGAASPGVDVRRLSVAIYDAELVPESPIGFDSGIAPAQPLRGPPRLTAR
jgi:hypothetical protein